MKKRVLFFVPFFLFAIGATIFYSEKRVEAIYDLSTNVEALTRTEEGMFNQHCRCHNDNYCYGGNAISFRKSCKTIEAQEGHYVDCHEWDNECE